MAIKDDVKVPQTTRDAFDAFILASGAHIRSTVHAPAREVIAVENPSGGFEMRVQETGPFAFVRRMVREVIPG